MAATFTVNAAIQDKFDKWMNVNVTRYLTKSTVSGKGLILASGFEKHSPSRKRRNGTVESDFVIQTQKHRRERILTSSWPFLLLLLFIQSGRRTHEMVTPTFMEVLPPSVEPLWKSLQDPSEMCVLGDWKHSWVDRQASHHIYGGMKGTYKTFIGVEK